MHSSRSGLATVRKQRLLKLCRRWTMVFECTVLFSTGIWCVQIGIDWIYRIYDHICTIDKMYLCDSMLWTFGRSAARNVLRFLRSSWLARLRLKNVWCFSWKQAPELKLLGLWDVGTNFCIGTEHQELFPKYPPFFLFQWKHPFLDAGCACWWSMLSWLGRGGALACLVGDK